MNAKNSFSNLMPSNLEEARWLDIDGRYKNSRKVLTPPVGRKKHFVTSKNSEFEQTQNRN